MMEHNFLNQIERFCTQKLTDELPDKMIYHDIAYVKRVVEAVEEIASEESVTQEEKDLVLSAAWLSNLGFTDPEIIEQIENPEDLFVLANKRSQEMSDTYLDSIQMPEEQKQQILNIIEESQLNVENTNTLSRILEDALTIDWGKPKSKGKVKRLYEEFLLTGAVSYGKSSWYDSVLTYLRGHQFKTSYGKNHLEQGKLALIQKVEKEKKELDKTESTILKKELNISDTELKKLKKSLTSVKGRDERGIQTLFRTTSRNHYTLNQMVDRKANIMISVNAILLSLIISRTIGQVETWCIHNSPILIMLITSIASMIFAVVAIIPFKTQGIFTESQIREKKGNLLYYGNIHKMNYRDYEWGMLAMLNDGDFLYSSMIRDLYFLGQTLQKKSRMIRTSLGLFILGLVVSTIVFLIVSSMSDFHVGSAHI